MWVPLRSTILLTICPVVQTLAIPTRIGSELGKSPDLTTSLQLGRLRGNRAGRLPIKVPAPEMETDFSKVV